MFDKTGTLTMGKMQVVKAALFSSAVSSTHTASLVLSRVAALLALSESNSDHPIARALVRFAKELLGVADVQSLGRLTRVKVAAGRGIRCGLELHAAAVRADALLAPSTSKRKQSSSFEEPLLSAAAAETPLASFLRVLQIRSGAEFQLQSASSCGGADAGGGTSGVIEELSRESLENFKCDIVVGTTLLIMI